MQSIITYIRQQLYSFYPETEIQSLTCWILESVCGVTHPGLFRHKDRQISDKEEQQIREIVAGLRLYKPIQYLLGETEFFGLPFSVDENVLIPRPETEELVEKIIADVSTLPQPENKPFYILDIGTGSGCIAVALAKFIPYATVYALDVSEGALEIARRNAGRNQVQVHFFQQDILNSDFSVDLPDQWDLIVSNPPYVTPGEKPFMSANVLENEPFVALFVPEEKPLLFYERIADLALHSLKKKEGRLYFETSALHGKSVAGMLEEKSFQQVVLIRDISGNDRILWAGL